MAELQDLSTNANSNTGRFPNGMAVEQLNDAARELEAMIGRWYKDFTGQLATAGTAAAYTLITNRTISLLQAGTFVLVRAHLANTGAATFAVNGTAAKSLLRQTGGPLQVGDIVLSQMLLIGYNSALDAYTCIGIGDPTVPTAMPRVTLATLPAVTDQRPIIVTNESGGAVMAFSDGTNWRRVTDRAIVS